MMSDWSCFMIRRWVGQVGIAHPKIGLLPLTYKQGFRIKTVAPALIKVGASGS